MECVSILLNCLGQRFSLAVDKRLLCGLRNGSFSCVELAGKYEQERLLLDMAGDT